VSDDDFASEVESIRDEYRRRDVASQCRGVYTFENPAHAHLVFERERAILGALGRYLRVPLAQASILDVGCSAGVSLAFLALYGASASLLHGVDISESRIESGRNTFPGFDLRVSDGVDLPYDGSSFDLVQQITVLSSVPNDQLRHHLAAEMLRVLRPGGLVLSYDVAPLGLAPRVLNRALSMLGRRAPAPTPAVGRTDAEPVTLRAPTALDATEVRRLFRGATECELRRLSLYRPLAERLAGHDVALAAVSRVTPLTSAVLYVGEKPER